MKQYLKKWTLRGVIFGVAVLIVGAGYAAVPLPPFGFLFLLIVATLALKLPFLNTKEKAFIRKWRNWAMLSFRKLFQRSTWKALLQRSTYTTLLSYIVLGLGLGLGAIVVTWHRLRKKKPPKRQNLP